MLAKNYGKCGVTLFRDNAINQLKEYKRLKKKFDLILTDPPYITTSFGKNNKMSGMFRKGKVASGKMFSIPEPSIWFPLLYSLLKKGGHAYIFCNNKNLHSYLDLAKASGFCFLKTIIWDKVVKISGRAYMTQFEYILFLYKKPFVAINHCGTPDILSFRIKKLKNPDGSNCHDTQKPVDLLSILIKNSTIKKQEILDPFMGIASTGLACINTNRKFVGVEIDKTYFKRGNKRILKCIKRNSRKQDKNIA